jgi:hypothetical protein
LNELEQQQYEEELRRTRPTRPPENFMARLQKAKPSIEPARMVVAQRADTAAGWRDVLRWLVPALGLAVVALLMVRARLNPEISLPAKPVAAVYGMKADDVQVSHELVSSYDVVATLPGGQPVRFHCQKWNDQLVMTDTNRGVEIVQSNPRVEVVPVRFETY